MASFETLEGTLDGGLWFHYDAAGDVLYLRLQSKLDSPALGEETDDGFVLLRDESTDQPVGLTIVNWWSRFGHGDLPDSVAEIKRAMAPLAGKVAA